MVRIERSASNRPDRHEQWSLCSKQVIPLCQRQTRDKWTPEKGASQRIMRAFHWPNCGTGSVPVGLVLAFNITPIFAPPTVALLAYFQVTRGIDTTITSTRSRDQRDCREADALLSQQAARRSLPSRRTSEQVSMSSPRLSDPGDTLGLSYLAIFVIGPIPKGALFTAVGLARISPIPGAIVFGITRTGFYYVSFLAIDTAVVHRWLGFSIFHWLGLQASSFRSWA